MSTSKFNALILVDASFDAETAEEAVERALQLSTELLERTMVVEDRWMSMIDDTAVMRVVPMLEQIHPSVLTTRERDTILAALRQRQQYVESGVVTDMLDDIAADSGQPLTNPEIDELCERINQ